MRHGRGPEPSDEAPFDAILNKHDQTRVIREAAHRNKSVFAIYVIHIGRNAQKRLTSSESTHPRHRPDTFMVWPGAFAGRSRWPYWSARGLSRSVCVICAAPRFQTRAQRSRSYDEIRLSGRTGHRHQPAFGFSLVYGVAKQRPCACRQR
jgi:hypothetical protein